MSSEKNVPCTQIIADDDEDPYCPVTREHLTSMVAGKRPRNYYEEFDDWAERDRLQEEISSDSDVQSCPDLKTYFAMFPSLPAKSVITMCRSYATYLTIQEAAKNV